VLVEELKSASGSGLAPLAGAAAAAAAAEADDDEDDDGWEDEDNVLDLSLGSTKQDLLSYFNTGTSRQRDGETHAYLQDFFLQAAQNNIANFQQWFGMLTADEQATLNALAASQ
jgi:hypothetical protein